MRPHDRREFHDTRGMRGTNAGGKVNRGIEEGAHTLGGPTAPRGNYEAAHRLRHDDAAHALGVQSSEDYVGQSSGGQYTRRDEPAFGTMGRGSTTYGGYESAKK